MLHTAPCETDVACGNSRAVGRSRYLDSSVRYVLFEYFAPCERQEHERQKYSIHRLSVLQIC